MERLETEIYLRYKQIIESQGAVVPAGYQSPAPQRVRIEDLLDRYDAFCFDGYGTLYNRGSFVYEGALDWYTMLRAAGKQMRLITNAASDVDSVLAADAAKRGFAFSEAETISSGSLLKVCSRIYALNCAAVARRCARCITSVAKQENMCLKVAELRR